MICDRVFRTIAQAAGVAELDVHLLMNHSIPGVNAGHITRNKLLSDHLRHQQEAISRRILETGRPKQDGAKRQTSAWPALPSRRLFSELMSNKD